MTSSLTTSAEVSSPVLGGGAPGGGALDKLPDFSTKVVTALPPLSQDIVDEVSSLLDAVGQSDIAATLGRVLKKRRGIARPEQAQEDGVGTVSAKSSPAASVENGTSTSFSTLLAAGELLPPSIVDDTSSVSMTSSARTSLDDATVRYAPAKLWSPPAEGDETQLQFSLQRMLERQRSQARRDTHKKRLELIKKQGKVDRLRAQIEILQRQLEAAENQVAKAEEAVGEGCFLVWACRDLLPLRGRAVVGIFWTQFYSSGRFTFTERFFRFPFVLRRCESPISRCARASEAKNGGRSGWGSWRLLWTRPLRSTRRRRRTSLRKKWRVLRRRTFTRTFTRTAPTRGQRNCKRVFSSGNILEQRTTMLEAGSLVESLFPGS